MLGLLLVSLVALLVVLVYVIGFRLGCDVSRDELFDLRLDARLAERELNELTRQAFIAMAEHAMHRRQTREDERGKDAEG